MRTLELKKKSLEELSKSFGEIATDEQEMYVGGGVGTYNNPFTMSEFVNKQTFYGGYVDFGGTVTWIGPTSCCSTVGGVNQLYEYLNGANARTGYAGTVCSISAEFKGAFRVTDSFGNMDFVATDKFYGNQYCNASKALAYGKVVKTPELVQILGKCARPLAALGMGLSIAELFTADNNTDALMAAGDIAVGLISFATGGVVGILIIPAVWCGIGMLVDN